MTTAYHRDQAGAPALTYSTAYNVIAHFASLKTVLKACLISGYGSLPAAGWELIAEGTNYIVLRNGSHSGYVCLTWVSGGAIRVYLAETYTGMSGDVMVGAGLKTGVAASNATPQALTAGFLSHSSAVSAWYVVADRKTFVIGITSSENSADNELALAGQSAYRGFTFYAGEDSAGNFLAVGGDASTSASGTALVANFSAATGFTALKSPLTGLLVDTGSLVVSSPGLQVMASAASLQVGIIALPSVTLAKAHWSGGGVFAGSLRGVALVPQLSFYGHPSQAAKALGLTSGLTHRTANASINLGDGYSYFARIGHYLTSLFLITDNPEFWL
jgi:hypothetical protein